MQQVNLPETGFVRLRQLLGDRKADPPLAPIIPVSKSTLWSWCKTGDFPKPVRLGPGTVAWRVEDIRAFMQAAQ
jgi:predicted DNA-binding transcriptional regulator AlpA